MTTGVLDGLAAGEGVCVIDWLTDSLSKDVVEIVCTTE